MPQTPLLPFPSGCITGAFVRRVKRFSVEMRYRDESVWIHSNNSGSMMGLLRPGASVLASPAANPNRKLRWTQEAVRMTNFGGDFWVGVNTLVPNRLLEAAFHAGKLPWAAGYTHFRREASYGESRLDARLDAPSGGQPGVQPNVQPDVSPDIWPGIRRATCPSAEGVGKNAGALSQKADTTPSLPPLWVECKNVTMVEDNVACFPDAATERGQKHLREMMGLVRQGHRAACFYLIQRADGACFGPADVVDPAYADLFWQAVDAGVEMYPHRAIVTERGIDLGDLLPLTECRF